MAIDIWLSSALDSDNHARPTVFSEQIAAEIYDRLSQSDLNLKSNWCVFSGHAKLRAYHRVLRAAAYLDGSNSIIIFVLPLLDEI